MGWDVSGSPSRIDPPVSEPLPSDGKVPSMSTSSIDLVFLPPRFHPILQRLGPTSATCFATTTKLNTILGQSPVKVLDDVPCQLFAMPDGGKVQNQPIPPNGISNGHLSPFIGPHRLHSPGPSSRVHIYSYAHGAALADCCTDSG